MEPDGKVYRILQVKHFSESDNNFSINVTAKMINEDLLLTLTGGDVVHIGSIIMYDHQNKEMTINKPNKALSSGKLRNPLRSSH